MFNWTIKGGCNNETQANKSSTTPAAMVEYFLEYIKTKERAENFDDDDNNDDDAGDEPHNDVPLGDEPKEETPFHINMVKEVNFPF